MINPRISADWSTSKPIAAFSCTPRVQEVHSKAEVVHLTPGLLGSGCSKRTNEQTINWELCPTARLKYSCASASTMQVCACQYNAGMCNCAIEYSSPDLAV